MNTIKMNKDCSCFVVKKLDKQTKQYGYTKHFMNKPEDLRTTYFGGRITKKDFIEFRGEEPKDREFAEKAAEFFG